MHIREYKHTTMAKAISMLAFTFKTLTIIYSHTNTKQFITTISQHRTDHLPTQFDTSKCYVLHVKICFKVALVFLVKQICVNTPFH